MRLSDENEVLRVAEEVGLKSNNVNEEEDESSADGEDLQVELDNADPGLTVKRAPRIHEADSSRAAKDLGDNLSTKGTVERNDGVLILRQHRAFNADELSVSGQNDEKACCNQEQHTTNHADHGPCLLGGSRIRVAERSANIKLHERAHAHGHVEDQKLDTLVDEGRHGKSLVRSQGSRSPASPPLLSGRSNGCVGPDHVHRSGDQGGQDVGDNGDTRELGDDRRNELGRERDHSAVDHSVAYAPPARSPTALAGNVLDGGANLGGYRLGVDNGELGQGVAKEGLGLSLLVAELDVGLFIGLCDGESNGGRRSLNQSKSGNDVAKSVLNLIKLAERPPSHDHKVAVPIRR